MYFTMEKFVISGQVMTLTIGHIFSMTLMSNYSSFDAPQQEKYDAGKMSAVPLLSPKLLPKNVSRNNAFFRVFFSLEAKPMILDQI